MEAQCASALICKGEQSLPGRFSCHMTTGLAWGTLQPHVTTLGGPGLHSLKPSATVNLVTSTTTFTTIWPTQSRDRIKEQGCHSLLNEYLSCISSSLFPPFQRGHSCSFYNYKTIYLCSAGLSFTITKLTNHKSQLAYTSILAYYNTGKKNPSPISLLQQPNKNIIFHLLSTKLICYHQIAHFLPAQ